MPIYEYKCYTCKTQTDRLVKWEKKDTQYCSVCDDRLKPLVTAPARTAGRWGDTGGGFDVSLGRHFNSSMEKEKYLKQNGLIASSDLVGGKNFIDDQVHKQIVETENHIKDTEDYTRIMKETGSIEKALAETFSVDKLKSRGLLDTEINSGN
jgi:hypothetical protein